MNETIERKMDSICEDMETFFAYVEKKLVEIRDQLYSEEIEASDEIVLDVVVYVGGKVKSLDLVWIGMDDVEAPVWIGVDDALSDAELDKKIAAIKLGEINAKRATYYAENRAKIDARHNIYLEANRDAINARRRARYAEKKLEDQA